MAPEPEPFNVKLRRLREAKCTSRNKVAHDVGVDPSYLTRIEHGDRDPPRRYIVEALARELCNTPTERDDLIVSAGYAPVGLTAIWGPTIRGVIDVLDEPTLSPIDIGEFEDIIGTLVHRWLLTTTRRNGTV